MTKEQKALLWLLRIALGTEKDGSNIPADVDWQEVFNLSSTQGVCCVAFEGIQKLHKLHLFRLPTELTLNWYARCQQIEKSNTEKRGIIIGFGELVKPLRLAVLKGVDYAQYWPQPTWREFGDMDVYVLDAKPEELEEVARERGCEFDEGDYKHSQIYYRKLTVENHHTFTSFVGSKEAHRCEAEMQQLFKGGEVRQIVDSPLYSPNLNFTAAFLVAHAQNHFFSEGMSVRMVFDWLFFLMKEGKRVDWKEVNGVLERIGSWRFAVAMTEFCVRYLGLDSTLQASAGLTLTAGRCEDSDVVGIVEEVFNRKRHNAHDRRFCKIIERKIDNYIHMWQFRHLMRMPVHKAIWQSIAFNSYFNRHPKFKL